MGQLPPPARPCFYELPGLIADDISTTNRLRDAIRQRLEMQNSHNWEHEFVRETDEIIIDVELMMDAIVENPGSVITAFVYASDGDRGRAERMRDSYHEHF